MHYCGLNLNIVTNKVEKKLPPLNFITMIRASEYDLTAISPILPQLANHVLFVYKTYCDKLLNKQLNNIVIFINS